ncbi:MAG: pyridoxal-phosphate-dependent aminotransferase family protein [Anaerolineae bacterium]
MNPTSEPINLRVPGPTPLPPQVRQALAQQMISHRGPRFSQLLLEVTAGLQEMLQTRNDVLLLTCSGTGGLEAAVVNTLSPGDKVLSVSMGYFGDRFRAVARAFGAHIVPLDFEWGTAADPAAIEEALARHPDVAAVLVTHNETSTGVTNDLAAIARVVKGAGKLLLVDAISSAGSIELRTDEWGCDVVITGSQKGWMAPPGLAMVAVSPAAWEANARARMPRFYFDFAAARRYLERGQNPFTPAVSLVYALHEGLQLMRAEGLANIIARHRRVGERARQGIRALGLRLVADERHASNTVTAVWAPEGVDVKDLRRRLREEHGVELTGGQGPLAGRVFRIGHLGWVTEADIDSMLEALRAILPTN